MTADFGFLSIVPILITLVLAVWTRNVVVGLFGGVLFGVLLQNGFDVPHSINNLIESYLLPQLLDQGNAAILILMTFIGGLVALMEKSGGAAAFAVSITRHLTSPFRGQLAAWLSGIGIFFTDSGSPLIVGPVYRSVADRLGFSREKLAWIIDSTASPISILIPFIGWGIYAMGLIQKEYTSLSINESELDAFIAAIPFQFYALLALFLVPLVAYTGIEFGPMAERERRPIKMQGVAETKSNSSALPDNARPILIWLPLLVMGVTLVGLLVPQGFPFKQLSGLSFRLALSSSYVFATLALVFLMVWQRVKPFKECLEIYFEGMRNIFLILVVLVLAWSLGDLGKDMGAPQYITDLAHGRFPAALVPAVAFLVGSIISFATGSSWGTFAIMMPLILSLGHSLGAPLHVCIGAVLSGGLFGDHCSPISDTTILSSLGAGCSHLDHVNTQLPYALFNGVISILAFILAGMMASFWILVVALAAQLIMLKMIGRFGYSSKATSRAER